MTPPRLDPLDAPEDPWAAPCCSDPSHTESFSQWMGWGRSQTRFICKPDKRPTRKGLSGSAVACCLPVGLAQTQWDGTGAPGCAAAASPDGCSGARVREARPMLPVRAEEPSGRSAGPRGPGEPWPSSGLLSELTSLTGNMAAVFGGSTGRQCRTVVAVLDKGSAWIRSRVLACPRCLFVTWAVAAERPCEGSCVRMASSECPYFFFLIPVGCPKVNNILDGEAAGDCHPQGPVSSFL